MPNPAQFIRRFWLLGIAIVLIAVSWIGLQRAGTDLTTRFLEVEGIPMQFIAPQTETAVPGVAIAHGFSGSKQLMLGYAYTLAHNGYGVLLWDLPGHGANQHPFEYDALQNSFEIPFSTLKSQPEIDPQRLAVLGHSMGAGIAMTGGIEKADELDAVVAVSPMDAPVTADVPKNLSLQVGEWETWLIPYTQKLLKTAGGANTNLAAGKGRSLSIIANVEHATILFKDASHQQALNWLHQTFGLESTSDYRDRRIAWYGIHLLGWLMATCAILSRLVQALYPKNILMTSISPSRAGLGLGLGAIVGAIALKLISLKLPVDTLGGLMIGSAIGLWFLIAGGIWLVIIGQSAQANRRDLVIGMTGFIGLWIGFGAMAQIVWLPWFLTRPRLWLWVLIAIACIPWFLASSRVQQQIPKRLRLAWWLGQSLMVILGLTLSIIFLPSLGFMAIVLPLFPVLLALFSVLTAIIKSPWGIALTCAPFLSWLIVVPFPVQ